MRLLDQDGMVRYHSSHSCRIAAAKLMPTVVVPKPLYFFNRNATVPPLGQQPLLVVALTTLPPRALKKMLKRSVVSLAEQLRQPDRILVSVPQQWQRFGASANLSVKVATMLPAIDAIELTKCIEDEGPSTKLLCALPRLRRYWREAQQQVQAGYGSSLNSSVPPRIWVVLVDDDLVYRPWALSLLERAIRQDTSGTRAAFSYSTYAVVPEGFSHPGSSSERGGLLVGEGARMLAIRLDEPMLFGGGADQGIEAYFRCLSAIEPRARFHDDMWLAMYLHDVRGQHVWRVGGRPVEMAEQLFPRVHDRTRSYRSPGALNSLNGSLHRVQLVRALARARNVTMQERRCGVRSEATWCVGAWCKHAILDPQLS